MAGVTTFYVHNKTVSDTNSTLVKNRTADKSKNKHANHSKSSSKNAISTKSANEINSKFYNHKKISHSAESALVGYPSTFLKLVDISQLTIDGQVINLHSFVDRDLAYTIADIRIQDVLKGDKSLTNKTIRVMFPGGNITKKAMLTDVANKSFMNISKEEANSEEIVTMEQADMPLPKAGQKYALLLHKEASGTNNIPGEFWSIDFGAKGMFPLNSQGLYKRVPPIKAIGGGGGGETSTYDIEVKENQKMEKGMNELIQKKRNQNN